MREDRQYSFSLTPSQVEELVAAARSVSQLAYAGASRFPVGAALLGHQGRIYRGCNVENASYGLTVCAERNATFHGVAEGCRCFVAVAVWTPLVEPGAPCGACRQVLAEFAPADLGMAVVLAGTGDRIVQTTLAELLPMPFRLPR